MTPSGLRQLCNRLVDKVRVDLDPHKFRHTFAISYLRSEASAFALQKTPGHTTLDKTLRYAALMTEDLVNDNKAHSPATAPLAANPSEVRRDARLPPQLLWTSPPLQPESSPESSNS